MPMPENKLAALVEDVKAGNRRALARALTIVENNRPGKRQLLADLFPHTGNAWILGVTGAPGTGKSSLVNSLTKALRARDNTVGIIAVDPTSPFSGGAILGDRIRMSDHTGDAGVFIRSMATRGSLGGLARATRDAVRVMDAGGFDVVIVETVGAGQSEVDIVRTAHTTLVVEAPGMGDDVQAIKAGILEIADVLVVNKADRHGANNTVRSLRAMLELGHPAARARFSTHHGRLMASEEPQPAADDDSLWVPPVVRTTATSGEGINDLLEAIDAHRGHLQESGDAARLEARYIEIELSERLQNAFLTRLAERIPPQTLTAYIERIRARELDPQSAVEQLLTEADTTT
jgi:LAO/AO transport system kinase